MLWPLGWLAGTLQLSRVPGKCRLELSHFLASAKHIPLGLRQGHPTLQVLLLADNECQLQRETRTGSEKGCSEARLLKRLLPTASEGPEGTAPAQPAASWGGKGGVLERRPEEGSFPAVTQTQKGALLILRVDGSLAHRPHVCWQLLCNKHHT